MQYGVLQNLLENYLPLEETLIQMWQEGKRRAGVLIIPAANSVAIIMDNGNLAVFNSHQHGDRGSQVLVCKLGEMDDLLNNVGKNHNLCGSNFAELTIIVVINGII